MEAVLCRRSIRKYTDQPVEDQLIHELLQAAMSAPSAGNERPWHFIIINDRDVFDEIPKFHPFSQMLKNTNVAIMVCADLELQKYDGFWVQDCSAATQNILITAQALGLGACWLGLYPIEERVIGVRRLLGIPSNVIPLALVTLGYPAEQKHKANRFDYSRIHYNRWSVSAQITKVGEIK